MFGDDLAVYLCYDVLILYDDLLCVPLVVLCMLLESVLNVIKAARFFWIIVGDVYLALMSLVGPAELLIFRVEVNA